MVINKRSATGNDKKSMKREAYATLPLTRRNFILMAVSGLLIVIGFALMVGGGSDDPLVFSEDIFSNTRIVVGPLLAFAGFLTMAVAIIIRPKDNKTPESHE